MGDWLTQIANFGLTTEDEIFFTVNDENSQDTNSLLDSAIQSADTIFIEEKGILLAAAAFDSEILNVEGLSINYRSVEAPSQSIELDFASGNDFEENPSFGLLRELEGLDELAELEEKYSAEEF